MVKKVNENIKNIFEESKTKSKELMCLFLAVLLLISVITFDMTSTANAAGTDLTETPHSIMAGDKEIAVVGSYAEANLVIEEIKDYYGASNEFVKTIINPTLSVKAKTIKVGEKDPSIVTSTEAIESIIDKNTSFEPLFRVIVESDAAMRKEVIPFETQIVETDSLYVGESKVVTEGESGEKLVSGRTIYSNGNIIDSDTYEEKIIKEPVTKVIYKGTKEKPTAQTPGYTTGSFVWPFPSSRNIVSGYGYRFGPIFGNEFHMGYDIAGSYGAPIVAADGGTVVTAGFHRSYGYQVIIQHSNGLKTRYAHNSRLNVSVGDKVHKGQVISFCGSTGDSVGNHLHFEVLKNGTHTDPGAYL